MCEESGTTHGTMSGGNAEGEESGSETTGTMGCRAPDDVLPGDMVINSDSDIDAFADYTVVGGRLVITGPAITSIEGLNCLQRIGGQAYIAETTLLEDLQGLDNLERIQGELEIGGNTGLRSLDGLQNLARSGWLSVYDNSSLVSVVGLARLHTVDGDVEIQGNPNLPTCDAIDLALGISSVLGAVCVNENLTDACADQC